MTGTAGGFCLQTASIARLCLERRHQAGEPDEVEDATQIVGERSQAELTAHLLQTSHQERTLVHPLLDRSKRVLDHIAAPAENVRVPLNARLHSVQHGFVLETRDAPVAVGRALRTQRTFATGLPVGVVDLKLPRFGGQFRAWLVPARFACLARSGWGIGSPGRSA